MSQKNFAIAPSVSISRSKFKRPSQHKTTFNLGKIVPIYVDADILPGDTVSLDLAALVRMSTPIAPIMDNIFVDYYAFFVPNRLVWNQWKQFMGENNSTYGAATEPTWPYDNLKNHGITAGSLGDYFGLPVGSGYSQDCFVSLIPARSYYLIYNEWFRDQNLISPLSITLGGGYGTACVDPNASNANYYNNGPLMTAAKESDYFTRALPYAQKGGAVTLPLGDTASLKVLSNDYLVSGSKTFNPILQVNSLVGTIAGDDTTIEGPTLYSDANNGMFTRLAVDLTTATASTINQLRFAFQYQKFLEKDALYGTRYWEILKGHFGVTSPDATLQRPEFLGHFRQHINIDQVLQTSESGTTALGTPGANSVSGKSGHLISKSFVEHGTLMILAVARHDQTYGQGINRMWTRQHREDYYFPVFANLGAQVIKNKEIFGKATTPEGTFGFQEAWAEYRYKPSIVTGALNPSVSNSLGFWTLSNNFAALPTLSKSFIEQDRDNLARALVTGSGGPDFIADFYIDATYVRPMPMYSIPGLIDHH